MKIKYLSIVLIIYSLFTEHMISILTFNIRISHLLAIFFVLINFNNYILKNFRFNFKIIAAYILIIQAILFNDIIVGTKLLYTFNSFFFFLVSLFLYLFFFTIFLKDENNLGKFFIFTFLSLMIYKNGQFLFFGEESFAKVEAIYGSRFAGPFLFFTLGFSYYFLLKKMIISFILLNIIYFLISLYFLSYSHLFLILTTLFLYLSIITLNIRTSYFNFLFFIFLFIFSLDIIFFKTYFNDLLVFLFLKRADAFVFIPNIIENFPLGIGSRGLIYDYLDSAIVLTNYLGLETFNPIKILVSSENYTTTHSMVMHMLLKNGFISVIPFLFLFFYMASTIYKIVSYEEINNGVKFLSIYIFVFFFYALLFNGIGSFLTECPLYFAFIMSIKRNYNL